jgi:hypothetical protein
MTPVTSNYSWGAEKKTKKMQLQPKPAGADVGSVREPVLVTLKDSGITDQLDGVPQKMRRTFLDCDEYMTVAFDVAQGTCVVLTRKQAEAAYKRQREHGDESA